MFSRHNVNRRQLIAAASGLAVAGVSRTYSLSAQTTSARDLIEQMSFRERVAQLFFFEARGKFMSGSYGDELKRVRPGGVLFTEPNISTPLALSNYTIAVHATNDLIPPLICIDQEGGPVTRLVGDPAPGAVQMGTLANGDVRLLAQQRAEFLAAFGFDVNFAPVADVAYEATSTMASRSFGSDPENVAAKVSATVEGSREGKVIGAAKHFPGHGRTQADSHSTIPEIDVPWDEWLETDALPFKSAIEANVDMVMLGHLRYERIDYKPMSISKVAVRALREELGFQGVIVTDDLSMGALSDWDPIDVVSQAVDAGVDVLLFGSPALGWDAMIDRVVEMVSDGIIGRQEINNRAERVVALKLAHFGSRSE